MGKVFVRYSMSNVNNDKTNLKKFVCLLCMLDILSFK